MDNLKCLCKKRIDGILNARVRELCGGEGSCGLSGIHAEFKIIKKLEKVCQFC